MILKCSSHSSLQLFPQTNGNERDYIGGQCAHIYSLFKIIQCPATLLFIFSLRCLGGCYLFFCALQTDSLKKSGDPEKSGSRVILDVFAVRDIAPRK